MIERGGAGRSAAAVALALVATLVVTARAASALPDSQVPTQWIAKQYTELLGRAPTNAEWDTWVAYYQDPSTECTAPTLATLGVELAGSEEFVGDYGDSTAIERAARVTALVRAVDNRDPTADDWDAFFSPYDGGISSWDEVVGDAYTRSEFADERVPLICDANEPGYGFDDAPTLDVLDRLGVGLSRTQETLQAEIDAQAAAGGGTVDLLPGEVVSIGGTANGDRQLVIKRGVTVSTSGLPTPQQYARMGRLVRAAPDARACSWTSCDHSALVALEPGARLVSVWVDGQGGANAGAASANVDTLGSTSSLPTSVINNRVSSPSPGGAAIRAHGFSLTGRDCSDEQIIGNLVTGYPSHHELDSMGRERAVDGIAVHCEGTAVVQNTIVDASGKGVMVYGSYNRALDAGRAQRSVVSGNVVVSAGLNATVALGADATGECFGHLSSDVAPCIDLPAERSFEGASVTGNVFWTGARTRFDVGLLVGGAPLWGDHRVEGHGVSFADNTTGGSGARVNMGVSVLGMKSAAIAGNTSQYTLVDAHPTSTWSRCPLVDVGVGSNEVATLQPGSQESSVNDSADGCVISEPGDEGLEPIRVADDGTALEGATSGDRFIPWGMTIPTPMAQAFWTGKSDRSVEAFREIKRMGANTIRVLLQFRDFVEPPSDGHPEGTPNAASLARLAEFMELAEDTGIYIDVTGLGIEVDPDDGGWYSALDDNGRWAAQVVFWSSVAATLRESPAVAWYDLMNEPIAFSGNVSAWCVGWYAGNCYTQTLTKVGGGRPPLEIARAWMTRMIDAIRTAGDASHLVSVGMLPTFAGFTPTQVADLEDFANVHLYPRHDDPATSTNELQRDIDLAKSRKPPSQPLIIEETFPLVTGEDDVRAFIFGSRPEATGWLGHYFERTPSELVELTADPGVEEEEETDDLSGHALQVAELGYTRMFVPMSLPITRETASPPRPAEGTLLVGAPSGEVLSVVDGCPRPTDDEALAAYSIPDAVLTSLCPSLTVSVPSVAEGQTGAATSLPFDLTLSGPSAEAVTVDYTTIEGTATAGSDYTTTSGTITFAPGQTNAAIAVPVVGDAVHEPDESMTVELSHPVGTQLEDGNVTGSIIDDDGLPAVSIADAIVTEGNTGTAQAAFSVTLSNPSTSAVTVTYDVSDYSASSPADYSATSGTVMFSPGETTATITVDVQGDTVYESDEVFLALVTSDANATVARSTAVGRIVNDDAAPSLSITNASTTEGEAGAAPSLVFTVTQSEVTEANTTVRWATANGSAVAGSDYTAGSGTLTIPAGQASGTITVTGAGDALYEAEKAFKVNLSSPVDATIVTATGFGTILNDDEAPSLTITNASITEGGAGVTPSLVFTVTQSNVTGANTTVRWATANGTALGSTDYMAAAGTLTIEAGNTSGTVTIKVKGDTLYETDETVKVLLSSPVNATIATATEVGTILNDDAKPTLSVTNVSRTEGHRGVTTNFVFTVTQSKVTGADTNVRWTTANGTALASSDYTAAAGTLTILAGKTSATVTIKVKGDATREPNETFFVMLTSPVNATLVQTSMRGTINNDD